MLSCDLMYDVLGILEVIYVVIGGVVLLVLVLVLVLVLSVLLYHKENKKRQSV